MEETVDKITSFAKNAGHSGAVSFKWKIIWKPWLEQLTLVFHPPSKKYICFWLGLIQRMSDCLCDNKRDRWLTRGWQLESSLEGLNEITMFWWEENNNIIDKPHATAYWFMYHSFKNSNTVGLQTPILEVFYSQICEFTRLIHVLNCKV